MFGAVGVRRVPVARPPTAGWPGGFDHGWGGAGGRCDAPRRDRCRDHRLLALCAERRWRPGPDPAVLPGRSRHRGLLRVLSERAHRPSSAVRRGRGPIGTSDRRPRPAGQRADRPRAAAGIRSWVRTRGHRGFSTQSWPPAPCSPSSDPSHPPRGGRWARRTRRAHRRQGPQGRRARNRRPSGEKHPESTPPTRSLGRPPRRGGHETHRARTNHQGQMSTAEIGPWAETHTQPIPLPRSPWQPDPESGAPLAALRPRPRARDAAPPPRPRRGTQRCIGERAPTS